MVAKIIDTFQNLKNVHIGHCLLFSSSVEWTQCEFKYNTCTPVVHVLRSLRVSNRSLCTCSSWVFNLISWLHLIVWLPQGEASCTLRENKTKQKRNHCRTPKCLAKHREILFLWFFCNYSWVLVPIKGHNVLQGTFRLEVASFFSL